jgi:hypothetical protein
MSPAELQVVPKEEPVTPNGLLQMAVSQGADIDKLTKLLELQERWEAGEARKAYYAARKLFKDSHLKISKNGTGHNNVKYATLNDACAQIIPALAKFGITHEWKVKAADKKVVVSCVLSHELGYTEPNPPTMEADADTSGNKNAIQALGSSLKYLERYTLFAACGLDDGSPDKDGAQPSDKNRLADELVIERLEWIENCRDLVELQKTHNNACKMAQEVGDQAAELSFIKASNAQKTKIRSAGGRL